MHACFATIGRRLAECRPFILGSSVASWETPKRPAKILNAILRDQSRNEAWIHLPTTFPPTLDMLCKVFDVEEKWIA